MFLDVSGTVSEPQLEIRELENLKSLHVLAPESWTEQQIADALRAGSWGHAVLEGYAWLDVSTLRRRAGACTEPEWDKKFDAMINYAFGRGWCDDTGSHVRAHIEYR